MEKKDDRMFCPHCKLVVAKRTYRKHRQFFYDNENKKWTGINDTCITSDEEMECDSVDIESHTAAGDEQTDSAGNTETPSPTENERLQKQQEYADFFGCREYENSLKDTLSQKLQEIWDSESENSDYDEHNDVATDSDLNKDDSGRDYVSTNGGKFWPLINWFVVFLSSWATGFNISTTSLAVFLRFFSRFLEACSMIVPALTPIVRLFPKTVYMFNKARKSEHVTFKKFVVCPTCHSLYDFQDCVKRDARGRETSKDCIFSRFPNHVYRNQRKQCGTPLLKEVTLKDGKKKFYPRKVYSFKPIEESLAFLLKQKGFADNCEHWRNRTHIPGTYRDIYDGRIWRKFMTFEDRPFLSVPGSLGLMLNFDFFQPFKHSPYSVGVFYLAIMNLPRKERYLKENIIVAGIVPGPKEPNTWQINNYLKPLVDSMMFMWNEGFELTINGEHRRFYAMIICVACDIPACRKICGLMSKYDQIWQSAFARLGGCWLALVSLGSVAF